MTLLRLKCTTTKHILPRHANIIMIIRRAGTTEVAWFYGFRYAVSIRVKLLASMHFL